MMKQRTTFWFPSFAAEPDSKPPSSNPSSEDEERLGLNKCSRMAIIRNMETKIAVATNPNEMAFMEADPKLFQVVSPLYTSSVWGGLIADASELG